MSQDVPNMNQKVIIMGLHPKVAESLSAVLVELKARKLDVGMHSGLRTIEEQEKLYAKGRTIPGEPCRHEGKLFHIGTCAVHRLGLTVTNGQPWESWHNYGLAVDIVFKTNNGAWTWDKPYPDWEQIGIVGELFGFNWGGRWKNKDLPHLEMSGRLKNVYEAKEILFAKGIDVLWSLI